MCNRPWPVPVRIDEREIVLTACSPTDSADANSRAGRVAHPSAPPTHRLSVSIGISSEGSLILNYRL
jgi:hypothetical protein